jgi:hypothetical protein
MVKKMVCDDLNLITIIKINTLITIKKENTLRTKERSRNRINRRRRRIFFFKS